MAIPLPSKKPLIAALDFAGQGICVFPVGRNKHPMIPKWPDEATTDEKQIEAWAKDYPNAQWAAATGKRSGVILVDVDTKRGQPGLESLGRLTEEIGVYGLETMRVRTQSGGLHFWFAYPGERDWIKSVPELDGFPGIEIRGDRASGILPESFGEGGQYVCEEHYLEFSCLPSAILYRIPINTEPRPKDETSLIISHEAGQQDLVKIQGKQCHNAARKAVVKAWSSGVFETADDMLVHIRDWYAKNCDHDPEPNEIEDLVEGWVSKNSSAEADEKTSQADRLVSLVLSRVASLWATDEGREFCTLNREGHQENLRLRSSSFRSFASHLFYQAEDKAVGAQGLHDSIQTLCGIAVFDPDSEKHSSYVRIAPDGYAIYLDLGRPDWKVVRIEPGSWTVTDECPVKFVRPPGMLPIEIPDPDGDIRELRPYINAADENTWILIVAWLINAVRPDYSQPILVVTGEQGSAKTTLCRVLRRILDPNVAEMRSAPRELRDLAIAARNQWLVSVDNLASMSDWLSDGFCRLSTGGGMSTRRLYTDDEEELFDAIRPVVMNGIGNIVSRPDLMDRSVLVSLPSIQEERRLPESSFYEQVDRARSRILGGLLNCVAAALDNIDAPDLPLLPRMADFAKFVTAAAEPLEWTETTFVDCYFENRKHAHEIILENSPLAAAIMRLKLPIEKTATELLDQISGNSETSDLSKHKGFPRSAKGLSTELDRLAPNLREIGIYITKARTQHGRTIRIEKS